MSRMFCTLKEAAETLNTSEDQLQTLLERGILHEFRVGPHRLLKEDDVGALTSIGAGKTEDRRPRIEPRGPRTGLRSDPSCGTCRPSSLLRPAEPVLRGAPRLSVRHWFWMGLIQDRPMVIALLSGLVLLGLSALAAGLCFMAEAF